MSKVDLKDFMQAVRQELEGAQQAMSDARQAILFELQELEMELQVIVTESRSKEGGFDVQVLSGKGERSTQSETVQRVRLTYKVSPSSPSRFGTQFHATGDQPSGERGVGVVRKRKS